MNKNKRFIFTFYSAVGILLPFITYIWANILTGEYYYLEFEYFDFLSTTSYSLLSLIPFLILAAISSFIIRKNAAQTDKFAKIAGNRAVVGSFLALLAFSIQVLMPSMLVADAQGGLIFLFYIPYALRAIIVGISIGWIFGKIEVILRKKNLLVLAYGMWILLIILFLAKNLYDSNFGRFNLPPEPKITVDENIFSKTVFLKNPPRQGYITSLSFNKCSSNTTENIMIGGSDGVAIITPEKELVLEVNFEDQTTSGQNPVDIDNDGVCEYIENATCCSPAGFFDSNGKKIWSYGSDFDYDDNPDGVTPFDYNSDGALDFIMSMENDEKSDVISKEGKLLTSINSALSFSKAADIDNNGQEELISYEKTGNEDTSYTWKLVIRNDQLQIIKSQVINSQPISDESYSDVIFFDVFRWPNFDSPWHVLLAEENKFTLINLNTYSVSKEFKFKADEYYFSNIIPVKFDKNKNPYMIAVESSRAKNQLLIIDPEGTVVYDEFLKGGIDAGVVTLPNTENQVLLLSEGTGEGPQIWEYRLR